MKPLISIIIPVYNHALIIRKSLATIFDQTYRPLEIIIVNDGSTDSFKACKDKILASCEAQDCDDELSLKIINQENKGAASARNIGFKESKGDFVIFWDADTMGNSLMIEKMFQTLQKHKEVSYVYSKYKFGFKTMKSQVFNSDDLKKYNYIDTTSLIRREDFVGFDETLKRFQDWDVWLTLLEKNKKGIFIPEILFKKIIAKRKGISSWIPHFMYKLPWKSKKVQKYFESQAIVLKKHELI